MSEQPRVLFCCFDMVPGPHAESRRLTEYIKGLGDRFQVVVLAVKTSDNSHIQRYHGARLLRVPVGTGDLPSRAQAFDRAVRRQLESEEYLLVHFFDSFGGYALCERRAEFGYRIIYDACTFASVELPLSTPELGENRKFIARTRRQELFCLMNADAVIVGSKLGQKYVTDLGVPPNKTHTLRAPVDLAPFTPFIMGQPDGMPMRIAHLGHENPWNDLALAIDAMSKLRPDEAHLTIIGPKHSELHSTLTDQVTMLAADKSVEFQEPIAHDDIHKVLAATDVGLVTLSDVERNRAIGGPLARAGEYFAAGRPVIAADLPLARELIPAEAALFYTPGDASSLATAIRALAQDPGLRITMGQAAQRAAHEWDASAVRGALLDVYSAIAGSVSGTVSDDEAKEFAFGAQPSDAETQLGEHAHSSSPEVKNATDPAITHPAVAESSTDPETQGGRPPLMGVPLTEDPPVVVGEMLQSPEARRTEMALAAVTDLDAPQAPVVMGAPIASHGGHTLPWADAPAASTSHFELPAAPSQTVGAAAPLYPFTPAGGSAKIRRTREDTATPKQLPAVMVAADIDVPETPRARGPKQTDSPNVIIEQSLLAESEVLATPTEGAPAALHAPSLAAANLSAAVQPPRRSSSSGIIAAPANAFAGKPLPPISAPRPAGVSPLPPPPLPPPKKRPSERGTPARGLAATARKSVEVLEVHDDEIVDAHDDTSESLFEDELDEDSVVEAAPEEALPPSALDPWLAQLVHGFCPPQAQSFERHVPPTTMPGRT